MGFIKSVFSFGKASPAPVAAKDPYMSPAQTASVYVTQETALTLSAFYAGVRIIANSVAQLPWQTFSRDAKGHRTRQFAHPAETVLDQRPNDEMGAFTFRQVLLSHALMTGNGYAEIQRDNRGAVVALWPLSPDRVEPKRAADGRLIYEVYNQAGPSSILEASEIFHLRGMGYDGIRGYSVIRYAARSLGLAIALDQFGANFFSNSATPSGVVTLGVAPKDPAGTLARLKAQFQALYSSLRNSSKTVFLDPGSTYQKLSVDPDEAQFLESRQFTVSDVARWLGVPPHLIGDLLRATNNNIEHQGQDFLTYGLMPWIIALEQEANAKLFGINRQRLYTKINVKAFLRGDMKARADFYKGMIINGIMTVNEVRALEDLDPIGPEGDVLMVQGQMTTLKSIWQQMGHNGGPPLDDQNSPDPNPDPGADSPEDTEAVAR